MRTKKSQAAIEFLVTYGWAILGVIIAIAALSYFGVFNTTNYTKDMCDFGSQFNCEDYIIHQDGWVALKLRNNFGTAITVTGVDISIDDYKYSCYKYQTTACNTDFTTTVPPDAPCDINPGSVLEIYCNTTAMSLNEKTRVKGNVEFQRAGGGPAHEQTGEMITEVQPTATCTDGVQNCHEGDCEKNIDSGGPCP